MMWKLMLLFTVVPAVELFLLIKVGTLIGPLATVLVILATGVVGAWLAKREGLHVLQTLVADLQRGLPPAARLVEAGLVLVGGVLLVTPGMMTDLTGLMLVFPVTRRRIAPFVLRWLASRFRIDTVNIDLGAPQPAQPRTPEVERRGKPFDHPVR